MVTVLYLRWGNGDMPPVPHSEMSQSLTPLVFHTALICADNLIKNNDLLLHYCTIICWRIIVHRNLTGMDQLGLPISYDRGVTFAPGGWGKRDPLSHNFHVGESKM